MAFFITCFNLLTETKGELVNCETLNYKRGIDETQRRKIIISYPKGPVQSVIYSKVHTFNKTYVILVVQEQIFPYSVN